MINLIMKIEVSEWLIYLISVIGIISMIAFIAVTIIRFITYFQIRKLKMSDKDKIKAYVELFKYKDVRNDNNT